MASAGGELFQLSGHEARELSNEELVKLKADVNIVPDFKQNKLEVEAKKNWDLFYKRNTTKFFKDRHWTKREFEELTYTCEDRTCKRVMFEVGCGVGNFMFPLLEEDPNLYFYACDFSPRAVDFVKSHTAYDTKRCTAFQCDITQDSITDNVPEGCVDVATLIFVLSAIHPDKMVQAVRNVAKTLKPGGVLLFRDYGLYDHAMLRFAKGHKLSDYFYVRQDGTRAYYFSLEKLNSIMEEAGQRTVQCNYVQRSTVNKKEGVDVRRIFVQGKFAKWDINESVSVSNCKDSSTVDSKCEVAGRLACHHQLQDSHSGSAEKGTASHEATGWSPPQDSQSHDGDRSRKVRGTTEGVNILEPSQCTHGSDLQTERLCDGDGDHGFQDLKVSSNDNGASTNTDAASSSPELVSVMKNSEDASSNNDVEHS